MDAFQATFLVLGAKAGSLWVRDSIAPWLHRVAFRVLTRPAEVKRRQEAERRAAELNAGSTGTVMPDDLADILQQEIDRLPERHRIVIILCDLEGRSREEAARHMRCPVGTVKSRLARARDRLREVLIRRGVMPAAVSVMTSRDAPAAFESLPQALAASTAASTIRGSGRFAIDTNKTGCVSKTAVLLAEGVVREMIRARLQSAILVMLATFGLLIPAWLARARQAAADPAKAKAPAAERKIAIPAVDFKGNWLVRYYPGGNAVALIGIEGPAQQPHARLLSVGNPELFDLARSKVDHLCINESTVRFTLQLFIAPGTVINGSRKITITDEIVAYGPEDHAKPSALRGAVIDDSGVDGRGTVLPVALERTDRVELGSKDSSTGPGLEDLRRHGRTNDLAKKKENLDEVMKKYRDTPIAPAAAWCLAMNRADARAPEGELRVSIDQAARIAARHGREMEIGAINLLVGYMAGAEEREALLLEYARKAVAMLHQDDSAALQIATLRNLATILRRATKIDEGKALAEVKTLDDRIATLARRDGHEPARAGQTETGVQSQSIPWAQTSLPPARRPRPQAS